MEYMKNIHENIQSLVFIQFPQIHGTEVFGIQNYL